MNSPFARTLPLLGAALALGCGAGAATAPAPEAPPFLCSGRPNPTVPRDTAPGVPMGRVEVRLLSGPFGRNLEQVHLRVLAENVPLGVFAGALSDALGVGVAVEAPLVSVRVGLAFPDVAMIDLFRTLNRTLGVEANVHDGRIDLEPDESWRGILNFDLDAPEPIYEGGYRESHVLTMPDSVPPAHFAAYFCDLLASSRGSAVVLGPKVVITDDKEHMDRILQILADWPTPTVASGAR